MSHQYQTLSYDVVTSPASPDRYTVRRLGGKTYERSLSFGEACQLADLYQDEDDHKYREEE